MVLPAPCNGLGAQLPEERHLGTGGCWQGAGRRVKPLAPKSLQPRTAQIPPNAQAQLTPKRLPHLLRKCSPSEVVGEESGKEILVEGEVISFKLQGFSSRSFQVASAQHFTVFLEKTFECLTTIYLNKVGDWEWKGRWFSFEQKGTAAVQAEACIHGITARTASAELPQTKAT